VQRSLLVVRQDGTHTFVYGLGGRLISQTDATGQQTYVLSDGLGSTVALTDGSGTVTATYEYDVYGDVRASSGTTSTEYRFTGQQAEAATGLVYLRARYYDPQTGRFLQRDPFGGFLGDPQGQQPYAYAHNNPVTPTDPSGEVPPLLVAVGVAALVGAGGGAGIGGVTAWWTSGDIGQGAVRGAVVGGVAGAAGVLGSAAVGAIATGGVVATTTAGVTGRIAAGLAAGSGGGAAAQATELALGWRQDFSGAEVVVSAALGGGAGYVHSITRYPLRNVRGWEAYFSRDFRIGWHEFKLPKNGSGSWANRPHYHRRGPGGIGAHRPWQGGW
jgi:RHS repeat-associated protein